MTARSTDAPAAATSGGPRVAIPVSADDARAAIDAISRSAPDAARTSRDAAFEAFQRVEHSSDERIVTGATLSLGLLVGLLIGGAPRLFIALALVPLTAFGMVLLERWRARPSG